MSPFFARFRSKAGKTSSSYQSSDRDFLVFENTSEVTQAEKLLKSAGWLVRVMGPPPEIQRGCDLVIEYPLIKDLNIRRLLTEAALTPLQAVPVSGPLLQPVDLFQTTDYGAYLMVRAANMKICIEKDTQTIVNISGRGCPDVPYLAARLVGKKINDPVQPRDIGHTLVFHYLQPDVDWHNQVLFAVQAMPRLPILIADAGYMYAAKMSGQAQEYDLFTPDIGELAFLADEEAPHPFYTRGFILHMESQAEPMITRAYQHQNVKLPHLVPSKSRDFLGCIFHEELCWG